MKPEQAKRVQELMSEKDDLADVRKQLRDIVKHYGKDSHVKLGTFSLCFYTYDTFAGAVRADITSRIAKIDKKLEAF
jgi:hypothetical protein